MEEFLKSIGLSTDNSYNTDSRNLKIDYKNSNEWTKAYSILEKNDGYSIYQNDEDSFCDEDESKVIYENDDYRITLVADFEEDLYYLICERI